MNNLRTHNERKNTASSSSRKYNSDKNRRKTVKSRKAPKAPAPFRMRLQLDHRTIITITKESSLAFWKGRYPNLTVMP